MSAKHNRLRSLPPFVANGLAFVLWVLCFVAVMAAFVLGFQGKMKGWPVLEVIDFQHWTVVPVQLSKDDIPTNALGRFAMQIRHKSNTFSAALNTKLEAMAPDTHRLLTNPDPTNVYPAEQLQTNLVLALNRVITNGLIQKPKSVHDSPKGDDLARENVHALHKTFPELVKAKFRAEALAPFAILGVFLWTLVALLVQYLHLRREDRDGKAFTEVVERSDLSETSFLGICNDGTTRCATRVEKIVRCGLVHSSLNDALPADAALDAASLGGSYTSLRVYIWVLPVLGFIGTAMGLSESIAGFKSALRPEATLETLMAALNSNVIPGLAASFYVTIIALLASAVGHFCLTMLQAWDEEILGELDRACLELLRKLAPTSSFQSPMDSITESLARVNEASKALLQTLQELEKWFKGAPGDGKP